MDIKQYYGDFMQEILAKSNANQDYDEAIFTEKMCDFLVEQAVIDNYVNSGHKKTTQGIKVDAWNYDRDKDLLVLFTSDFRVNSEIESLTQGDVDRNFKRVEKLFIQSLDKKFYMLLEESSTGYPLAREICENAASINTVNVIILSNGSLSDRVNFVKNKVYEIKGDAKHVCKLTYDIWDLSRIFRIESSGKAREDIVIDFRRNYPDGISCLAANTGNQNCESYLLVLPGKILADLYDKYSERLLEQNVRTFLQFRGNVNKGIRNTIVNNPDMFFAYNNGLSVTAENVEMDETKDKILSITNLQIVNGGQTTASIYTALKKNKADLSEVYVQVKLSIIAPDKVDEIVPRISEYANTQNKVSAADFFSNHPFHLRIEEFSRRLWAPSKAGGLRETRWFYERTRGQYANAQARLTPTKLKEFLSIYPKSQMFTKTDLAKYEYSMEMLPHIVSLGAQKCFANYASKISQKWEERDNQFNELYFKRLVAKSLIFRFVDDNIMKQSWYEGGYKAQIVTYTVAKLAQTVKDAGMFLNLEEIWRKQGISDVFKKQLLVIAGLLNIHIQLTPDYIANVTEWAKKLGCWQNVQSLKIVLSESFLSELIDNEESQQNVKQAVEKQKMTDDINKQIYVLNKTPDYWKKIRQFNTDNSDQFLLTPKEMSILDVACSNELLPSEKQAVILLEIEEKVVREGFAAKNI